MRRFGAIVVAISFVGAIGCDEETPRSRGGSYTPPPTKTTLVPVMAETMAASTDGKFGITFPAGSFLNDVNVTITDGVRAPHYDACVGKTYGVTVAAATADGSADLAAAFNAELTFTISEAEYTAAGGADVAIGSGDEIGDAPTMIYGTFDNVAGTYTGNTTHLSWFVLLDTVAYSACPCNVSFACDDMCACDERCVTEECLCDELPQACDEGCECDPMCCVCDETPGTCDPGCECDLSCGVSTSGYPYETCTTDFSPCGTDDAGLCAGGACFYPCDGTSCPTGFTCSDGYCMYQCEGDGDCTGNSGTDCCNLEMYVCLPAASCGGSGGDVPDGWVCIGEYYGDMECDCGCGVADVDCSGAGCETPGCTDPSCAYCWDEYGEEQACQ